MDLMLKDRVFIVGGATSGFGLAITERLIQEGARVIGVARTPEKVAALTMRFPDQFTGVAGDIASPAIRDAVRQLVNVCNIGGLVLNAGGPPATSALETTMDQWDAAWQNVFRWKVEYVNTFLPLMQKVGYGRILFVESYSVKQPVPNLVLSNSLRMAVVGYAKTLSHEIAASGVTLNILAPGFHQTPAADRVVKKRSETSGVSQDEARQSILSSIPMKKMGSTDDFASLAAWLLSPHSAYLTGQTISADGAAVLGVFG